MTTPRYKYLLCDLLTDQLVAYLPLTGVSFSRRISRVGELSGTLTAPDPARIAAAKLLYAYAGRAALWVYRDDALWWGGIPWTCTVAQGKRGAVAVDVQAATFDSYAHHRRLYSDVIYQQADEGQLIPDLWNRIQADPSGDIGVQALDQPTGMLRDRTYAAVEQAWVGDLIEELGDLPDGPEHTIDVWADAAGDRHKRLRIARQLGATDPRIVFERAEGAGGQVTDWQHVADASSGGTAFQTRGDGIVSDRVDRDDLLAQGWPRLDYVEDREGVTDMVTLDAHAQALAVDRGGSQPVNAYTVEVARTGWTPNSIGDAVRLRPFDRWHDRADLTVRPVGCEVTPPEGSAPETVSLLLTEE